ncbi:MAG TPA: hypothetical protein VH593_10820 [Ktedonobacteraceae bacterium]|jgi:hypothetical protein
MKYSYMVCGVSHEDNTWEVSGQVETELAGDFINTPSMAMQQAFEKLTQGKAVYGKPGWGCNGPYRVTKLYIQEEKE